MGATFSSQALRESMLQSSYLHVLRAIEASPAESDRYSRLVYATLISIADASLEAIVGDKKDGITREDLRSTVELVHEWAETIASDCPQCRLPQMARQILEHNKPTWDREAMRGFVRDYMLNVCGFVDDAKDEWHSDQRALARIVERINKAELITRRSISSLADGAAKEKTRTRSVQAGAAFENHPSAAFVPSAQVGALAEPGQTVALSNDGYATARQELGTDIAATDERFGVLADPQGSEAGELDSLESLLFV